MNLRDWEILETIKVEGNLSKAAKKIYLTQPAVTSRVKQMEKELGVKILYRTNRGAQLTPQGEYLANRASSLVKKVDDVKNALQRMNDPLSGTIKISAANFMMRYKLPEILSGFQQLYPKVKFKVETGWSQDMIKKLQDEEVDIAFVRGDYNWKEGRVLLFEEPISVVSMTDITIDQLPSLPRIDYRTDRKLKLLIDSWWMQNFTERPKTSMVVSRTDIGKEMVRAGLGYSILPKLVVHDIPGVRTIDLYDDEGNAIVRPSWMTYRSKATDINVVSIFIDYIKEVELFKVSLYQ